MTANDEPEVEELLTDGGKSLTPDLLGPRNELIVAALAEGSTYKEAARLAGVNPKTVQRRMSLPAFAQAVAERRSERMGAIAGRLAQLTTAGMDTIADVLEHGTPQERLRAARMTLDYGGRYHDRHLFEMTFNERLAALEAQYRQISTDDWDEQ